jgi:hypothetical protein
MHDSLPLHLFSREMVLSVFTAQWDWNCFWRFHGFSWFLSSRHPLFPQCRGVICLKWLFMSLTFIPNIWKSWDYPPMPEIRLTKGDIPHCTFAPDSRRFEYVCSLIIILRTSDGPTRLNRIRSNPLEPLSGKTRVRCREVNTMKRFVSGLAEEFLKLQSRHFLELIALPKRKTSIRVDCEPWSQSDPFYFT